MAIQVFVKLTNTKFDIQSCPCIRWLSIHIFSYLWFTVAHKKNWKIKEINCSSFKTCAKGQRAITWWNPAAQMHPVLDSSSFVPAPTLSRRTCLHSASSILTVHISCHGIAVFVFRNPLFTLTMAPKHKSSDAGSASKPRRSRDILSISAKVKILDMIEIEKKITFRDCQIVWQERIVHKWSDEEQRKNSC